MAKLSTLPSAPLLANLHQLKGEPLVEDLVDLGATAQFRDRDVLTSALDDLLKVLAIGLNQTAEKAGRNKSWSLSD